MSVSNDKINSMIFDHLTTTRTDFQTYGPQPVVKPVSIESKRAPKTGTTDKKRESTLKYTQTLREWQSSLIPFDLLTGPKDILQTNPHIVQPTFKKPPDLRADEVRRTRPRLIISPAVVVDDVEDVRTRNILMESTYTSESRKAFRYHRDKPDLKAPLREKYAPPLPVELERFSLPKVAPEWRMDSMKWERKQLRGHCQPTDLFWKKRIS